MRAVQITEFGGPEVLKIVEVPDPVPGDGELLVDVSRVGLNFADTVQCENAYLVPAQLPLIPGMEVIGTTADGRRVVGVTRGSGAYAERASMDEASALPVPEGVDDLTAIGLYIQGLTAWWLLNETTRVRPGESIVVNAAAGGVGSLAVQLARNLGAGRIIATASTPDKRELAVSLGADVAIDPATEELTAAIVAANGGKPVDVVLEMTGGRVTDQCLAALGPFGRLAFYGMAGRVEPERVSLRALQPNSLTVSGFWLLHALARPAAVAAAYGELVAQVAAGKLRVLGAEYPMSEVRQAHEALRGRRVTGKLVIDPSR
ncbi:MAG: NADPH:quinone reductase [Kribbellaceae bacterium]|jgi:NADPH2:quinone reductase|nr:NADPH:quinone reductase [Kribbellaceae bacterium]